MTILDVRWSVHSQSNHWFKHKRYQQVAFTNLKMHVSSWKPLKGTHGHPVNSPRLTHSTSPLSFLGALVCHSTATLAATFWTLSLFYEILLRCPQTPEWQSENCILEVFVINQGKGEEVSVRLLDSEVSWSTSNSSSSLQLASVGFHFVLDWGMFWHSSL